MEGVRVGIVGFRVGREFRAGVHRAPLTGGGEHNALATSNRRAVTRKSDEGRIAMRVGKQSLSFASMVVVVHVLPEQTPQRAPPRRVLG